LMIVLQLQNSKNYVGKNYPKQNDDALFLLSMKYFF